MSVEAFVLQPDNYPEPIDAIGCAITELVKAQTAQSYEITMQGGPEGVGPPPHRHPWDEAFFVLSGSVEFTVDDKQIVCAAGSIAQIPAGTVHCFRFGPDGGNMLDITGAGSKAIQLYNGIADGLSRDALDVSKAAQIFEASGASLALD